jgi:hypothetical protein
MDQPSPPEQLARMLTGYWFSQSLHVAARLGIADRLKDGPKTAEALAAETGMHARSLYRLLRALAGAGVFSEGEDGRFSQTPVSEGLREDVPGSQRAMALMMGDEHYRCWGDLLESIRTGGTAFERIYGQPIFDYLSGRPEQARVFDAAMTGIHGRETRAMLDVYDFSGVETLADVGGGNGSTLLGVLQHYPRMQGLLYDLPGVVERARPAIEAAGVADRCRAIGGNFFESVPVGADAYLLRHIIHDWSRDQCLTILRNVRDAMGPESRVLVVENVLPPGNAPSFGKVLDLNMLVIPGGEERTEEEYRQLYEEAGLRLTRVVPTSAEVSVVEGRKA